MTPNDLARFGFPTVQAFQRATTFPGADGMSLVTDGHWGAQTAAAAAHLPLLSPHFDVNSDNLRSKGNGLCLVRRELIRALEVLRAHIGRPVPILDAYRDPAHNRAVGGASESQHPDGLAADFPQGARILVTDIVACHRFSGFGVSRSTGHVLHADVRHLDPRSNVTHSTVAHPARWWYE